MKRTVSLFEFMPYGAPELLAATRAHLAMSLAAASLSLVLAFGIALQCVPGLRAAVERHPIQVELTNADIVTPPAFRFPAPPRVTPATIARTSALSTLAIPVPVAEPDARAIELAHDAHGGQGAAEGADMVAAEPDAAEPGTADEAPPIRGVYRHVDELPVSITEFKPPYPELARDAGIEGLVIVHALVGRDGRVMRVELDEKFAIPLLNENALEAAKRWVFKPAYVNGHPVPVWADIPFHFVLRE